MKYYAAIAIPFLCATAASPKSPAALDLYRNCQSQESALRLACTVYIRGFLDGLQAGDALAKGPPIFCPPKGVYRQIRGNSSSRNILESTPQNYRKAQGRWSWQLLCKRLGVPKGQIRTLPGFLAKFPVTINRERCLRQ